MKHLTLILVLVLTACGGAADLPDCDPHNYQDRGIVFTQIPNTDPPQYTCYYTD